MKFSTALLSAAVAGITLGFQAPASASTTAPGLDLPAAGQLGATDAGAAAKHACKGQNACKGQGGCKSDKNSCKGQNACKGQGGCRTDGKK